MKTSILAGLILCFAISLSASRDRDSDEKPINITQPQYQVISPEILKQMGSQEESLREIERRLGEVEKTLREMRGDIRTLMDTNVIVNFVMGSVKLLVPGLLVTGFGVWLAHNLKQPKRKKSQTA